MAQDLRRPLGVDFAASASYMADRSHRRWCGRARLARHRDTGSATLTAHSIWRAKALALAAELLKRRQAPSTSSMAWSRGGAGIRSFIALGEIARQDGGN